MKSISKDNSIPRPSLASRLFNLIFHSVGCTLGGMIFAVKVDDSHADPNSMSLGDTLNETVFLMGEGILILRRWDIGVLGTPTFFSGSTFSRS
jgi:hypothetical protein